MKETIVIDKDSYNTMYQSMMDKIMEKYPYHKRMYVSVTKEEYADYLALSYCRQLEEIKAMYKRF